MERTTVFVVTMNKETSITISNNEIQVQKRAVALELS